MDFQCFANLFFYCVQRVQGGHRLLKDHADPLAPNLAQAVLFCCQQVFTFKVDGAAWIVGMAFVQQAQNR